MTAATTILEVFLCFTLLAVLSWQAAASTTTTSTTPKTTTTTTTTPTTPAMSPPTHDELTSSLFVNQLAILHLMHDSSNMSYATAEMQRLEQAHGERIDRLLAAVDVQQKAHGERIDRLLAALEVQQRHTQQVLDTNNDTNNSSSVEALLREAVNSDNSLTSLCEGDKLLTGIIGALEVNSSGTYSSNTMCSWDLKFPRGSSVSITWDYIEMESSNSCTYDWVEVLDVTRNSQHVYGKKLCGQPSSSFIKLLNMELHGTNNLKVNFRSDNSNQSRGFRMLYRAH